MPLTRPAQLMILMALIVGSFGAEAQNSQGRRNLPVAPTQKEVDSGFRVDIQSLKEIKKEMIFNTLEVAIKKLIHEIRTPVFVLNEVDFAYINGGETTVTSIDGDFYADFVGDVVVPIVVPGLKVSQEFKDLAPVLVLRTGGLWTNSHFYSEKPADGPNSKVDLKVRLTAKNQRGPAPIPVEILIKGTPVFRIDVDLVTASVLNPASNGEVPGGAGPNALVSKLNVDLRQHTGREVIPAEFELGSSVNVVAFELNWVRGKYRIKRKPVQ